MNSIERAQGAGWNEMQNLCMLQHLQSQAAPYSLWAQRKRNWQLGNLHSLCYFPRS